jgi:hypothetical protein
MEEGTMACTHTQDLDEKSEAALRHVVDLADREDGTPLAHDLSDPLQAHYLDWLVRGSGMTPERYPGTFKVIAPRPDPAVGDPGPAEGAFEPNQIVDFMGPLQSGLYNGKAKGHATFTRTNEIEKATLYLMVVNYSGNTTTVLASGMEHGFGAQTLRVTTEDEHALQMGQSGSNKALLSWAVRYRDGGEEIQSLTNQWSTQAAEDPKVEQPVQKPERIKNKLGDLKSIVIGLSRAVGNKADIDYWFWQSEYSKTELLVPLVGSMKFEHPLAPLNENNPILEFYLARQEGGMSNKPKKEIKKYRPFFEIDPNDPTNLKFKLEGASTTENNAINFGASPWVADTKTFFTCRVTAAFQNAQFGVGMASILSSETEDKDPTDGVAYIKPLVFVWHCLVEGTKITMADGSTKAVEEIQAPDEVAAPIRTRKVLANLAQPHWGEVFTVTLSSGKSVTCSGTHPFITVSRKPVAASALAIGEEIRVAGGRTEKVTSKTQQKQAGQGLFNIWLEGEPTAILANGIWVGEYQLQVEQVEQEQNDPERVRARLAEDMLRDFESHLEDTAARA